MQAFFYKILYAAHVVLLCGASIQAQPISCGGVSPEPGPLGYRERTGDIRCEGFYRSPVAGFDLELLSLTRGPIDFQLRPESTLYVSAPDLNRLKADRLRIQARALPISTFYRMDATANSATIFKWPMSSLHSAKLTADKIGLVGWVDQGSAKTYVAVSISQSSQPNADSSTLIAILRSSVDVEKLFWRRWPEGKPDAATAWTSTGSIYRAGQPIRIDLQLGSGTTVVAVSAKTVGSDDWANILAPIYQP